jgi:hypothetical protein
MTRIQIGTVQVIRTRSYCLDPYAGDIPGFIPSEVLVEPGEYPLYQDGLSRYWRMTGVLNRNINRMGDGLFSFPANGSDMRSDDDVVFYSRRYGPDDWALLVSGFQSEKDPALVFSIIEAVSGA